MDGIRLGGGGTFGILAFVLGRGLHAVLALLPMILGAAVGAGLADAATKADSAPTGGREPGWSPDASPPSSPRWPCWR